MTYNMPIPLKDELALGLLGRFARLNGMSTITWAIKAIKSTCQNGGSAPNLWLIAEACCMEPSDFALEHSMLPVMYPISRYIGTDREVGNKHHLASIFGLSTSVTGLRWCPDCIHENHMDHGYSHWQRQHQINGIDWCHIHHVPLVKTDEQYAIYSPGLRAFQHHDSEIAANVERELSQPALQRMQHILLGWLQSQRPIQLQAWNEVVSQRCRELGLRMGEVGKRPVVSDLIQEQFSPSWLHRYFPEIASKHPHTFVRKVDGACIDRHVAYPALASATILGALFASAEHALAELNAANQRLLRVDGSKDVTDHAITAFLNGRGLHQACNKFGANIESVEARLRESFAMRRSLEQV